MTTARGHFEMFRFSAMQSSLSFSNIEILAVPTTSLLGTVDPIFVGK